MSIQEIKSRTFDNSKRASKVAKGLQLLDYQKGSADAAARGSEGIISRATVLHTNVV